jgi:hypothetical protein
MAWASEQTTGSASRKAVLYALANHANKEGHCRLSIETICQEAELGTTAVKNALSALADDGFLDRDRIRVAATGRMGIYDYQLRLPGTDSVPGPETLGDPGPETLGVSQELDLPGRPSEPEVLPPSTPPEWVGTRIQTVWADCSPPLIQHRAAYFADRKTRDVIGRKLKLYPAEVIAEAIANYATVLAGGEFMWSHSWTLIDFLNRGLDRFVPEARPLENFRRRDGEKFGRRDVSGTAMREAADRLEQRRGIESGTG